VSFFFFLTSCRYAFLANKHFALSGHSGSSLDPNTLPCQSTYGTITNYEHYGGTLQQPADIPWDNHGMGSLAHDPFVQDVPSRVPTIAMHPGWGAFGPNDFALSGHEPLDFDLVMTGFGMDPLISDPFFTGPNEPWNNAQHVVAPPPAPIAAPPPAPIAATPPASGNRIACSSPGCGKTFRRAGDCRRHMLKHGPPRFICPLNGCTMPFTRADKLRDHLRQGHKINQTCQRSSA
jgi:hypothetical protein